MFPRIILLTAQVIKKAIELNVMALGNWGFRHHKLPNLKKGRIIARHHSATFFNYPARRGLAA